MTGARPRRPVIGVMGSGVERHDTLAGAVGTWIASQGFHLLTGGGEGVMAAVGEAFAAVPDRRGLVIGVLPNARDDQRCRAPAGYPNRWVELAIRTHLPLSGACGTAPLSPQPHQRADRRCRHRTAGRSRHLQRGAARGAVCAAVCGVCDGSLPDSRFARRGPVCLHARGDGRLRAGTAVLTTRASISAFETDGRSDTSWRGRGSARGPRLHPPPALARWRCWRRRSRRRTGRRRHRRPRACPSR